MAAPPSAPRTRPASARGRLLRERGPAQEQASVLSHCSADPPPDSGGVRSGPGHYRHFNANSRHELRDPLRHGEQQDRDLPFYSLGPRSASQSRESGNPMRVMDFSKVNKDRHNWQKIDTFQTPHGNGQARCDSSQQRTRTSSRSRERGVQALAGIGLEIEDMRVELRSAVAEIREELSQTIAMAVNQTIAEIRSDVRAEAASLRQQLSATSGDGGGDLEALMAEVRELSRPGAETAAMVRQLAAEVDKSREELLQGQRGVCEELRGRSQAQLQGTAEAKGQLQQLGQDVRQLSARVEQSSSDLLKQVGEASNSPVLAAVAELRAAIQGGTKASAEAIAGELCKVQKDFLEPFARELASQNTLLTSVSKSLDFSPILEEIRKVDPRSDMQACLADAGLLAAPGCLLDLRGQLKELSKLGMLDDVRQWQANFDWSPVLRAVQVAIDEGNRQRPPVDLSPVLQLIHEDRAGLSRAVQESRVDLTSAMATLEHMRKSLTLTSQTIELGSETATAARGEVAALAAQLHGAMATVTEQLGQMSVAVGKADHGGLQADLHKVLEEVRDVRAGEVSKILRILQQQLQDQQEVDVSQVLRALQERKRADEEFSEKLCEEMHKLRMFCDRDLSEVLAAVQQIDAAKMLRAIRESKVSSDDLSPIADEVRRMSEELRQSRFSGRELSQVLDEVLAVKLEVQRQGRRDSDFSGVVAAIKEKRTEVDLSEVLREFQLLKDMLGTMRREEQQRLQSFAMAENARGDGDGVVLAKVADDVRSAVAALDLAPVISGLEAVKAKVELSSALKRQNEHMTKSDFGAGLEELRGHFSLVLTSLREVCDGGGAASLGINNRLQKLLEQKQLESESTAEDLDYLRRKLKDAQSVIGQVGSRHEEVMQHVQEKRAHGLRPAAASPSFADAAASSFVR